MSVGAAASSRTSSPQTSSTPTRPNSTESSNASSPSNSRSTSATDASRPNSTTERPSQTNSASQDRSEISSEASGTNQSPQSETETRNEHLRALEDNFSIFDNPEGGDNDGISGLGDFEKVASGEYDREKAEASLRSQGLSDRQIKERLDSVEDTAQYFLDDTDSREFVDSANDGEGKSDGKIGRQDLDKALLEVDEQERQQKIRDAESGTPQLTEEQREEALQTVARWQEPETLNQELKERPLSEFSQAELTALAAVSEDNPELQEQIEDAVNSSVVSSESLEDLPEGDAYNYLLNKYVTGQEVPEDQENRDDDPTVRSQKHLEGLTGDAIKGSLDKHLEGRSGDADLESAQQRVSSDLQTLALTNPALAKTIESQAESVFGEYSDKFTEIGRADDNWLQKAGHAVTGGLRSGVGWVTDGFRDAVDVASTGLSAPARLLGEVGEFAIEGAGKLAGAGLDAVGADGVADNVRNASEVAGDAVDSASDFLADQNKNFVDGLGESVAGTVDGLAYAITDPAGTAKGLYELAKDPGQLVDIYKDKVREQGVAGVAGELVGDVALGVLTGGSGAAAKGVSIAGKVAKLAPDGKVLNAIDGFQPFRNGVNQSANLVASPIRRGGQAFAHSEFGKGFRNGAVRLGEKSLDLVPDGVRNPISRLKRGVNDLLTGDDSAAFAARSAEKRSPEVNKTVEKVRNDFGDLKKEFESIERSLKGDELESIDPSLKRDELVQAQREKLRDFLFGKSNDGTTKFDELSEIATQFDALSEGKPPGGVGDILARNRVEALDYIKSNLDTLNPDATRRILRGLFADGDPSGPAFLTKLRADDKVFRAFDSRGTADGGYFSRVDDSRFDSAEQLRISALPGETPKKGRPNVADAGAIATVGEDSVALVTRLAEQLDGFGKHATGGGWQLQLFNDESLRSRLRDFGADGSISGKPVTGVELAIPGTTSAVKKYERGATLLRRAEQTRLFADAAADLGLPLIASDLERFLASQDDPNRR